MPDATVTAPGVDIADLSDLDDGQTIETDLCIIGSGPAGLVIASEFASCGLHTVILEAGGLTEASDQDDSPIDSVGEPRILDQWAVRSCIFGGTSQSWTGRCAPFDDIDFQQRPWVPHSGWPLQLGALRPYLDRACHYLGLGQSSYDRTMRQTGARPAPTSQLDPALLRDCYWQFSSDEHDTWDYMRLGRAFLRRKPTNVRILLHAVVSHIATDPAGNRVTAVEVTNRTGRQAFIHPRLVVLCAGGIENARILLYSNRTIPAGLGNHNDLVGRFLMDHPRCELGEFDPAAAADIWSEYGLFKRKVSGKVRSFEQGVSLSPELQERDGLLNCAAWLTEHRAPDDPWEAARRLLTGRRDRLAGDAWNVLSQPRLIGTGLVDLLARGRGVPHKLHRLVLDCIVEQRPDPDSRVTLNGKRDALGLPTVRLDWRISEQERKTAIALGQQAGAEFARLGLPVPALAGWVQAGRLTEARFVDVCHPTGTTRMSHDPRAGVVDENCWVHGVEGLFIAGSSIFPTTGHANPTLMIVALAIRLADHLKATYAPPYLSVPGTRETAQP